MLRSAGLKVVLALPQHLQVLLQEVQQQHGGGYVLALCSAPSDELCLIASAALGLGDADRQRVELVLC